MKKIVVFDYIRTLSVILVVYYHIFAMHPGARTFVGPISLKTEFLPSDIALRLLVAPYFNFGEIGVAFFFLLSGYLIMKSRANENWWLFLRKRVVKILPVSIFGTLFSCATILFVNHFFLGVSLAVDWDFVCVVILNAFLLQGLMPMAYSGDVFLTGNIMPVYWFLQVLVVFYLLVTLIPRWSWRRVIVLSGCLLLFVECSLVLGSGALFKYFSFVSTHLLYIFIGSLCYFFFDDSVGSGLSVWKICNERRGRGVALVGISSVFIFFILAFVSCQKLSDGQMLQSDMVRNYALALICFVFALCVSSAFKRVPALVSIVSKTSFTTYAIHYALASSVLYMLGLLGIPALLNYVLTFVLTFVVGGVLGTCVEIPISKFFRKYLLAK